MKRNVSFNRGKKEGLTACFLGVLLVIYSLTQHYAKENLLWQMSPYLFPLLTALLLISLGIIRFLQSKREEKKEEKILVGRKTLLITLGMLIAYCIFMPVIGFNVSTFVFLALLFLVLGEKRYGLILVLSGSVTALLYTIFGVFLHVLLP